jgi:hypothetical protein
MSGLPQALSVATLLRTKFPHDYQSQPTCLETYQTEGIDTLEVTFRQTNKKKRATTAGNVYHLLFRCFTLKPIMM